MICFLTNVDLCAWWHLLAAAVLLLLLLVLLVLLEGFTLVKRSRRTTVRR